MKKNKKKAKKRQGPQHAFAQQGSVRPSMHRKPAGNAKDASAKFIALQKRN